MATTSELIAAFRGQVCPATGCDAPKRARQCFCSRCYRTLPMRMQPPLWFSGGEFWVAYRAALRWLEENRDC